MFVRSKSPKDTLILAKYKNRPFRRFLYLKTCLFLSFFENDAFTERWVKFSDFNFSLNLFLVLARPNDMRRLG